MERSPARRRAPPAPLARHHVLSEALVLALRLDQMMMGQAAREVRALHLFECPLSWALHAANNTTGYANRCYSNDLQAFG
jgi:hypothetical protein